MDSEEPTITSSPDLERNRAPSPFRRPCITPPHAEKLIRWAPTPSSSWSYLIGQHLHSNPDKPLVVMLDGLRSQETMQQDLTTWLRWLNNEAIPQGKHASPLFYPAWEHLPHEAKLPHADIITERLETLCQLLQWVDHCEDESLRPPVIVSTVQAIMQRTFQPKDLKSRIRSIKVGDLLDPLDLVEWLEDQAYEPESKVTQKGELSLRGGILDVFSLTSPWPIRIEFFGDEVESIRYFDPETQLTREKLQACTLSPGGEMGILKQSIQEAGSSSSFASLLDYLPDASYLVLADPASILEASDAYLEKVPEEDPYYRDWEEICLVINQKQLAILSLEPEESWTQGSRTINLDSWDQTPQRDPGMESMDHYRPMSEERPELPVMEAQRRDFMHQLHRWIRQDYEVIVACNHEAESQRFLEIWDDHQPEGAPTPPPRILTGNLSRGMVADRAKLIIVTDAEIFGRYRIQRPRRLKSAHARAAKSIMQIDFTDLEDGDYVVHLQHGIGRYLGLKRLPSPSHDADRLNEGRGAECLVIEYAPRQSGDSAPRLYVPVSEAHLVSKYIGGGKTRPPLHTLGGKRWQSAKQQAEKAIRDLAGDLLKIQAMREAESGFACQEDTPWQREFESSFPHEETEDQNRAIAATKEDMEKPKAMDRLVCGDVGFGKTEVAIRAAFKAVMGGRQVAVLVPTTVLAQQHYNHFADRMAPYPVRVELLSRFQKPSQVKEVLRQLAIGSVDLVVGTHKLIQKSVSFKDLGLVIIDEEQRFGVTQKESFKQMRQLVDVLTLSATPIPRTLHLALMGARDMSTIETPPQDRLPVETIVIPFDEDTIQNAIRRELNRQGQVYFLHNRVSTIEAVASRIQALVPEARIVVGHGQMEPKVLEGVMRTFINGKADILVSTTIIESGIDIPNANTIMIDRADRFGLSELYQLRGRVGRYKHQAYAYLLLPRHAGLLTDARKRLSAMKQYSKLGSGFKIAMRDLEIRGAGNLLGAQQSGHITAIGFDLYCQLLKQSIASLKGETIAPRVELRAQLDFLAMHPDEITQAKQAKQPTKKHPGHSKDEPLQVPRETAIFTETSSGMVETMETEQETIKEACFLPMAYVQEPQQRVEMYRKIAEVSDELCLERLRNEFKDRFGPLPEMVERLLLLAELKWRAFARGFTEVETSKLKLKLKRNHEWLMLDGKFPRLQPVGATKQLQSLIALIQTL